MKKACKAVLISIQPKWVSLILSGKKTLEIRKTAPKLEAPFKCYIYQTLPKSGDWNDFDGKVVGEFVCDQIEPIAVAFRDGDGPMVVNGGNEVWYGGMVQQMSCLSTTDISRYIGGIGGCGYGWHISDLVIYDTPKGLDEFCKPCPKDHDCYGCAFWFPGIMDYGHCEPPCCGFWEDDASAIRRAPQSWCYVEELTA